MNTTSRKVILSVQSVYYLLLGTWVLCDIFGFMGITGYTTDVRVIKTAGVLIICIAIALLTDVLYRENSSAIAVLSLGSAIGLLSVSLYYNLSKELREMYLVDSSILLAVIVWWIVILVKSLNDPN